MSAELLTDASRALDANGSPLGGAKWRFYASGTLTPLAVYENAALSTSLGAVVTADGAGRFVPIYFNNALSYRGRLEDAAGNLISRMDIDPINTGGSGASVAVLGYNQAAVRSILAGAGDLQAVLDALPADGTDDVRIAWDTGAGVFFGGALYTFIKDTLGYTTEEMTDLLASASASTDFPQAQGIAPDTATIAAMMANFAAPTGSGLVGFRRSFLGNAGEYRTLQQRGDDIADLRDYGSVDLTGDNGETTLVQTAFTQASAEGVALRWPTGKVTVDDTLTVLDGLSVLGDTTGLGRAVAGYTTGAAIGPASRLHFAHSGVGVQCGDGSAIYDGVLFRDFMTTRDQPAVSDGVLWEPDDHDYDFVMNGMAGLNIQNVLMLNPTRGINMLGGGGIGRLFIDNLMMQPMVTGIDVDLAADVVRGMGLHFWPIWRDHLEVNKWTINNCDHVWTKRCDTPMFTSFFSIASRSAFRISKNVDGATTKMKVSNYDIDYSQYGIWFDDDSENCWARFDNGTIQANNSTGVLANIPESPTRQNLRMDGTSCYAMFNGLEISGASGAAMDLGDGNYCEVNSDFWVQNYGEEGGSEACIAIGAGSTFVRKGKVLDTSTAIGPLVSGPGRLIGIRQAYVPSVTPAAGAYTSTPLIDSEYIEDGYKVSGSVNISIVTVGTGTGALTISAPTDVDISFVASAVNYTTKEILAAQVIAGNPGTIQISKPGGGNVAVNGQTLGIQFEYVRKA